MWTGNIFLGVRRADQLLQYLPVSTPGPSTLWTRRSVVECGRKQGEASHWPSLRVPAYLKRRSLSQEVIKSR